MNQVAGIDGCSWGWIAVVGDRDGGRKHVDYLLCPTFEQLVARTPEVSVYAVDIPIGLPDTGLRQCDVETRALLRPRGQNRVFWAPVWEAVKDGMSYNRAAKLNKKSQQRKIQPPCFAIFPKINEVNELLARKEGLRSNVFEVHPEVSLRAMNQSQRMEFGKKGRNGDRGIAEREAVLKKHSLFKSYRAACAKLLPNNRLGKDDIIDAHAALWTARRIAGERADRLPKDGSAPIGANGLPMLMWI